MKTGARQAGPDCTVSVLLSWSSKPGLKDRPAAGCGGYDRLAADLPAEQGICRVRCLESFPSTPLPSLATGSLLAVTKALGRAGRGQTRSAPAVFLEVCLFPPTTLEGSA